METILFTTKHWLHFGAKFFQILDTHDVLSQLEHNTDGKPT